MCYVIYIYIYKTPGGRAEDEGVVGHQHQDAMQPAADLRIVWHSIVSV